MILLWVYASHQWIVMEAEDLIKPVTVPVFRGWKIELWMGLNVNWLVTQSVPTIQAVNCVLKNLDLTISKRKLPLWHGIDRCILKCSVHWLVCNFFWCPVNRMALFCSRFIAWTWCDSFLRLLFIQYNLKQELQKSVQLSFVKNLQKLHA